jgi:lipopolysaccharide export system permease protein
MVFGNMSEKYELSSLKSAGVSLVRVLFPAIMISIVIAVFSFYCSNTLIPISNLKFQSRLYDIRVQKPALNIEEGVFNVDFKGYSIHIGEKAPDNRRIGDILIFDNSPQTKGNLQLVSAKSGEMYYTEDKRFFVMRLFDGYQYQEMENRPGEPGMPFIRTHFREWVKEFDMSEFEMRETDEKLFKSHHTMKSVRQLAHEIDTLAQRRDEIIYRNYYDFSGMFKFHDTIPGIAREDQEMMEEAIEQKRLEVGSSAEKRIQRPKVRPNIRDSEAADDY